MPKIANSLGSRINDNFQIKLYDLIYQRTLASQVKEATIEQVAIDVICTDNIFRLNGSMMADLGFMQIYKESVSDKSPDFVIL